MSEGSPVSPRLDDDKPQQDRVLTIATDLIQNSSWKTIIPQDRLEELIHPYHQIGIAIQNYAQEVGSWHKVTFLDVERLLGIEPDDNMQYRHSPEMEALDELLSGFEIKRGQKRFKKETIKKLFLRLGNPDSESNPTTNERKLAPQHHHYQDMKKLNR